MLSGVRVAVFHEDAEVASRVAGIAAERGIEILRPEDFAALDGVLGDPLLAAVVLDVGGPKSGGFELVERVARAPSRPLVMIVTALDGRAADSIRHLGQKKKLNLLVFRKINIEGLRGCLAALKPRIVHFGREHLHDCVIRHYVSVEYQPKVPLHPGSQEYAVEALCRLRHPQFGAISPERFVPLAERNGLIAPLTDAVVCQAFGHLCQWRGAGHAIRLALNVSPELLKTGEWCEQFLCRCREYEADPRAITLEITESCSGAMLDSAVGVLNRLRREGFTLSIDDFGTGFSSLAALYRLPFGELKIDKSFTFDLKERVEARTLIESTIGMAQRLGLKVVAEGVESEAALKELRLMGCQHAQGYFISKSIPPAEIPAFFTRWASAA